MCCEGAKLRLYLMPSIDAGVRNTEKRGKK